MLQDMYPLHCLCGSAIRFQFCKAFVVRSACFAITLYVHCRLKKIDSPAYTSTKESPAHAPCPLPLAPCFKVRVTVDGHAFESPNFFKSRKTAQHAAVNVALMSFPFDGFQEASSLTESCHMPASVQGGSLSSPPMAHADCSAPSISDSGVGRPTGTRSYLLYNKNQGLSMCSRHFISKGYYCAAN
ncbi:hypothetical protein Q3G72_025415 [Acer saccharum]|nr:hypothetical protein Q3G72_025415 [Acer saccharum]